MSDLKELMRHFPFPGIIEWIGIRPAKRAELKSVDSIELATEKGIVGDHYKGKSGNRHVTLIQSENIELVRSLMQLERLSPALLRRNIVVRGINLHALLDKTIRIGADVELEITGLCHPCSRMEENLGYGGYNAMRNKGGLTAKVISGGTIKLGDKLHYVSG